MRHFWRALGWTGLLAAISCLSVARLGLSAEEATTEKKAPPTAKAKEPKSPYHRLPPYYGQVVTPEQRKQIYAIQDEYGPKIDALRKQLEALMAERDAKIAALLTEEQRKELARLQEEAKAKRQPKEKTAPPAGTKPPAPSETPEAKKTEAAPAVQQTPATPTPAGQEKPKT
jgi:Spy/CpxP family protein refolding chaperone